MGGRRDPLRHGKMEQSHGVLKPAECSQCRKSHLVTEGTRVARGRAPSLGSRIDLRETGESLSLMTPVDMASAMFGKHLTVL